MEIERTDIAGWRSLVGRTLQGDGKPRVILGIDVLPDKNGRQLVHAVHWKHRDYERWSHRTRFKGFLRWLKNATEVT